MHPDVPNLYVAGGISRHGMRQAPAASRGIAEPVLHGAYRTLNRSPLSVARLAEGRPLLEWNAI
jgi:glycine/D-amino acid oxidase-like deaminating enzyme